MNQRPISNTDNHFVFIQGERIPSALPALLREFAESVSLVGKGRALNVGVARCGAGGITILPVSYHLELDKVGRNSAAQLLGRVVARYGQERQAFDELESKSAGCIGSSRWLIKEQAAVSLWHDYIERGPLATWATVKGLDPIGKPDWSRSLSSDQWIRSARSGKMLPARIIYTSLGKQRDDLFSSIYHWLVGLGASAQGEVTSVKQMRPRISPIEALAVVKREQRRAFRRRDRRVVQLMIEALEGGTWPSDMSGLHDKAHYVVTDFDRVWEDVLRQALDGVALSISLPAGQWQSHLEEKGIVPLPDVLRSLKANQKELFIIDAKFYADGKGSAGDHYKQVIYAKLARHLEFSIAANVLMFAAKPNETALPFKFIRRHSWKQITDSLVHEVFCDYDTAARAYANREKTLRLQDLMLAINNSRLRDV